MSLAGSDIYLIAPDGSPRKLWSSREDVVYALAFDAKGRLIAGTGNKGRIYEIDKNGGVVGLFKGTPKQVTAFRRAADGRRYRSSSNLGKGFLIDNAPATHGAVENDGQ